MSRCTMNDDGGGGDDGLDFDFDTVAPAAVATKLKSRLIRLKGRGICSSSSSADDGSLTLSRQSSGGAISASSSNNRNKSIASSSSCEGSPGTTARSCSIIATTKSPGASIKSHTGKSPGSANSTSSSLSLAFSSSISGGSSSSSKATNSRLISNGNSSSASSSNNTVGVRTSHTVTTSPAPAFFALGRTTKNQRLRQQHLREQEQVAGAQQGGEGGGESTATGSDNSKNSAAAASSSPAAAASYSQDSSLPSLFQGGGSPGAGSDQRHVRFSLGEDASVASVSQSSVTTRKRQGGGRPPLARASARVAAKNTSRQSDGWLVKMTSDDSNTIPSVPGNAPAATNYGTSARCLSRRSAANATAMVASRPPHARNKKKSATTTTDVVSVQEAGSYQMLCDECAFLCGTVMQSQSSAAQERCALSAASDLACMLSSKQNRRTLFFGRNNNGGGSSGDDSPLQAVLGVFAWAKTLLSPKELVLARASRESVDHCTLPAAVTSAVAHGGGGRTKTARKRQLVDGADDVSNVPAAASPSAGSVDLSTASCASNVVQSAGTRQQQFLDAIGMCLYFVSLDCTMSDEAATSGSTLGASKAARRIRKAILTNRECLQGIIYLALADPMTQRLRGEAPTVGDGPILGVSPLPSVQFTNRKIGDDASSIASSSTPNSVASPSAAMAGTPDSQSSASGSIDPTVVGRLKRKRRLIEQQQQQQQQQQQAALDMIYQEHDHDDKLSFASETPLQHKPFRGRGKAARNRVADDRSSVASSTDSHSVKALDQLDRVTARILCSMQAMDKGVFKSGAAAAPHRCGKTDQNACLISSYVPLIALTRIVSGKCEGSDKSCIDDDLGQDEESELGSEQSNDDYNPLLETNRLLGENGAIPLLSQALAETLACVTHQLKQRGNDTKNGGPRLRGECQGCVTVLQDRASMLVSLVDGASLLSESNRQLFCEEGFTSEAGGFLIVGLIAVLRKLLDDDGSSSVLFDGVWGEITLATLRMLTSLTHENKTAAKELEVAHAESLGNEGPRVCGLDVIAGVLRKAVKTTRQAHVADGKLIYDSIIFCLNVFANAVESGGSCRILSGMTIPSYDGEGNFLFLTWLTRWLVGETSSFREAVVESTFGTSPSKHQERKLDAQEDEKLVTAGNGFVLLSCLLVDKSEDEEANESTIKIILTDLPGNDREAKFTFLKNTLKAFCNFYHYSIGDLSVAIVSPVKLLIKRLEYIQEQWRQLSLGC